MATDLDPNNRALPAARATHEPSPDGLGHSVGVPNAEGKQTQCPQCPYWLPGDIDRCPLCPHDGTHELSMVSVGHSDQALCSCGWSSRPYWDGVAWAEDDWKKHVGEQGASR